MDTLAIMAARRKALRKGNPHWRRGAVRKKDRGQNNRPKEWRMDSNLPFQDHIERGLFRVVVKTGEWGGMMRTYRQTLITAKGMAVLGPALADLLPPLPAQQTNLPLR